MNGERLYSYHRIVFLLSSFVDYLIIFRLGTYGTVESRGWTKNENGEIVTRKALMWSCISGAFSGVSGNPGSVVKTRLQSASHHTIAVGRQHNYTGMLDAVKNIYKTEGLRGFFVGLSATCLRLAIGSTAQLTTFSKYVSKDLNF